MNWIYFDENCMTTLNIFLLVYSFSNELINVGSIAPVPSKIAYPQIFFQILCSPVISRVRMWWWPVLQICHKSIPNGSGKGVILPWASHLFQLPTWPRSSRPVSHLWLRRQLRLFWTCLRSLPSCRSNLFLRCLFRPSFRAAPTLNLWQRSRLHPTAKIMPWRPQIHLWRHLAPLGRRWALILASLRSSQCPWKSCVTRAHRSCALTLLSTEFQMLPGTDQGSFWKSAQ